MTHAKIMDYIAERLGESVYCSVNVIANRHPTNGPVTWSHSFYADGDGTREAYTYTLENIDDPHDFAGLREIFDEWLRNISEVQHNTPLSKVNMQSMTCGTLQEDAA